MAGKKHTQEASRDFFFTLSFLVIMSLLIGCFLGYLWIHNAVTSTIQENVALRKMETELENRNKELRSEITSLSRGDRIKRMAREQLDMRTPAPESLVIVLDEEQITVK